MTASDVTVLTADADQARLIFETDPDIHVDGAVTKPSGALVTLVTRGGAPERLQELLLEGGIDAYVIATIRP